MRINMKAGPMVMLITCIYEYVHMGSSQKCTGQNLALGKPAWQHPGTHSHGSADLAVNGDTNPDYRYGRSCTHTDEQSVEPAYWTVDLGDLYYITGVRIYNRNVLQDRLLNFKLIGNPGNVTLYDDATQVVPQYNKAFLYARVHSAQQYRNITVYLPLGPKIWTVLTLCEVEIFGGCFVPELSHGTYSGETKQKTVVTCGSYIQAKCSTGYKLVNGDGILSCTSKYTWDNPVPVCTAMTCKPLALGNGTYTYSKNSDSSNNYTNGTIAIPMCNKGFELHGARQRACQEDETWSGREPFCSIVVCSHPCKFNNGHYTHNSTVLHGNERLIYNSTVKAVCEKGYRLRSNQSIYRICSEHGNWTGIAPYCDPEIPTRGDCSLDLELAVSIAGNVILCLTLVVFLAALIVLKKKYNRLARQPEEYMNLAEEPITDK